LAIFVYFLYNITTAIFINEKLDHRVFLTGTIQAVCVCTAAKRRLNARIDNSRKMSGACVTRTYKSLRLQGDAFPVVVSYVVRPLREDVPFIEFRRLIFLTSVVKPISLAYCFKSTPYIQHLCTWPRNVRQIAAS